MTPQSNGWRKIVLQFATPIAIALVGYGVLKADVRHLQEDMQTKASRETIQAQYDAIRERLDRIERKLDAIKTAR